MGVAATMDELFDGDSGRGRRLLPKQSQTARDLDRRPAVDLLPVEEHGAARSAAVCASARSSVDLPQPFGPMIVVIAPSAMLRLSWRTIGVFAVGEGDVLGDERG